MTNQSKGKKTNTATTPHDTDPNFDFVSDMKKELTERRLYSFAKKIDAQYKDRFGVLYTQALR